MADYTGKVQKELLSVRDTVESIWVAIILAFILRAFMVEAFVIPTGSMAPRLLGQHYDLQCPSCGWEFSYTTPGPTSSGARRESAWEKDQVLAARCPNCGKDYEGPKQYSNGGDRVLVMKFLYNFAPPRPWDVVVFRNPQDNEQNYIKRLIGVPGETIQIVQGDVFVKTGHDRFYKIRRKSDPHVQEAMWQIVYDNDYRPDEAQLKNPVTPRWSKSDAQDTSWDLTGGAGRHFGFTGSGPGAWHWLRFEADPAEGRFSKHTRELFLPRYGYNSYGGEPNTDFLRDSSRLNYSDVCSDLKLDVRFVPGSAHTHLGMLLTSFRNAFRADVSADGAVKLYHAQLDPTGEPPGETGWREWAAGQYKKPLAVGQGYQVALTHADYRVTVWIDGQAVAATGEGDYTAHLETTENGLVKLIVSVGGASDVVLAKRDYTSVGAWEVPTPTVQLAASGGPGALEHVQLHRDVYYTGTRLSMSGKNTGSHVLDYSRKINDALPAGTATNLCRAGMGNPITLQENRLPHPGAPAGDPDLDSFFVLGDNSPSSLDSRAWIEAATTLRLYAPGDADGTNKEFYLYQLGTVPRYNMIGKALFVYWPSGHRLPGLAGLPIVPNFGRMRFVR
ncbi:MAG: signal peptidase I [Planctomycetota bacterium]|nr:signal peptidase I [Planctomycetota bacterium]